MRGWVALVAIATMSCGGRTAPSSSDLAATVANPVADLGACVLADGGTCTLFPQCGCGSGQACDVFDVQGTTACRPAGSTPNWNDCKNAACVAGSSCVPANGVCAPLCANDSDCGGPYHLCEPAFPGLHVCTPLCDPVDPQNGAPPYTACGAGVGCQPLIGSSGASFCTQAAACGAGSCAVGFVCVGQQCRKACHVGSNADCTVGLVCVQMTNPSDGSAVFVASAALGSCN